MADVKEGVRKRPERISIKDRLAAYKNLPRFFVVIWKTKPGLTFTTAVLRVIQAVLPITSLWIAKSIINGLFGVIRGKHPITDPVWIWDHLWKWVIIEFLLVIFIAFFSKIITLLDDLLGELLTNRTNAMIIS